MANPESEGRILAYRGSRLWSANIWGATVAGICGGILMLAVCVIGIVLKPSPRIVMLLGGWIVTLGLSGLALFPGNMIASFPYEVVIEKGRGVYVRAPLRNLFIPFEDIEEIRRGVVERYVIRLRRRHRLLREIVIHRFYGSQAPLLADAVGEEVRKMAASRGK